jgi:cyclase
LKKVEDLGAGEILLTSMYRDGTKSGFDLDILSEANKILNIPLIASGGVGSVEHFYDGVTIGKADALLAASVFHFNEFSIMDVKKYLKKNKIEIRL